MTVAFAATPSPSYSNSSTGRTTHPSPITLDTSFAKDATTFISLKTSVPSEDETAAVDTKLATASRRGIRFWLIIIAMLVSTLLCALDLTYIAVALPTIVDDLDGKDFVWAGASMALGTTAFLPMSGGLAQVFGRRSVVLVALGFFALGSALCGFAQNLNMFIVGRVIQGIGAGGVSSLTEVIIADLVPLRKRGPYLGILGAVFALAGMIGPVIGGGLAQNNWRWIFYLNLPITGISMVLVACFLDLKVPEDEFRIKMKRMDWLGNKIVILSIISLVIALSEAGIDVAWTSYKTILPLILGIIGLGVFFLYEFKVAKEPMVPFELVNNRTSVLGYVTAFLHGLVSICAIYYFPVYFQGAELQKPLQSGVSVYGMAFTVAPAAIASGLMVSYFGKYRPINFVGWFFTVLGFGLLSLLRADSNKAWQIAFQEVIGIGLGILYAAPIYAIMAPQPLSLSANALALNMFVRSFSGVLGIAIGSSVLENTLKRNLSDTFLAQYGAQVAYSLIPAVGTLVEPMQGQVRDALAEGMSTVWKVMFGVSMVGAVCVFFMKEFDMAEETDIIWGMVEKRDMSKWRKSVDIESKSPLDFADE
ncbi:hypothetical protein FRB97_008087 [Tulasnella sp. 331]|nr:hypothetical protein FRB97_008087 [Tulasnella sp. 331]